MPAKVLQACLALCNPMDWSPTGLLYPWDFPGKNMGVGSHAFSSLSKDGTPVSCITGGFFTIEPLEKSKTTIGSSNPTSEYFSKRTEIRKNCFIPMCIVVLVTIAKRRKHQEMKKNSDMYSFWNIIYLQK